MTGEFRKMAQSDKSQFDPRKFLTPALKAMEDLCRDRFEQFATAGNASRIKPISVADMAKAYASGALDPKVASSKSAA
jgi:fructose-bisphosphate aldolase class II